MMSGIPRFLRMSEKTGEMRSNRYEYSQKAQTVKRFPAPKLLSTAFLPIALLDLRLHGPKPGKLQS